MLLQFHRLIHRPLIQTGLTFSLVATLWMLRTSMEISCCTMQGETFSVLLDASAAVKALKISIHDLKGIAPDLQRLLLGETFLDEAQRSLASFGIRTGSIITLLTLPRPQALLEVEVWTERGLFALSDAQTLAPSGLNFGYPATVIRACLSGCGEIEANGVYRATVQPDILSLGAYKLRWLESIDDFQTGWHVTSTDSRLLCCPVAVEAAVKGIGDAAEGTYTADTDMSRLSHEDFVLVWHEPSLTSAGTGCGWYLCDLRTQVGCDQVSAPSILSSETLTFCFGSFENETPPSGLANLPSFYEAL